MKFLILILFLTQAACSVVSPEQRAVRFTMGSMSETIMEPGAYLYVPFFAGNTKFNVKIQPVEIKTSSGTRDQQEVSTSVTINLQIDPTKITQIVKEAGNETGLLDRVKPLAMESVNATISKYNAEELLTRRQDVKQGIETLVRDQLAKYGVIVHDVAIQDLQYSREYSEAIERKQVAEQQAKQAEYVTQKAEQDAKAAIAKAKGEAEANRLLQLSITKEILLQAAIAKWKGDVPQVMGSGGGMIFNIPMTNKESK